MASYLRPATLPEALAALASGPRTLLAGGTDHFPARATFEPSEDILDLTALPGLQRAPARRTGLAASRPADVDRADRGGAPAAVRRALRRRPPGRRLAGAEAGTLAGNVCNASPAADGIPALLALDAEVELAARNRRRAG